MKNVWLVAPRIESSPARDRGIFGSIARGYSRKTHGLHTAGEGDILGKLHDGEINVRGVGDVVEGGVADPLAGGDPLLAVRPRHVVLPHHHLELVHAGPRWLAVGRGQHRVRGQERAAAERAIAATAETYLPILASQRPST